MHKICNPKTPPLPLMKQVVCMLAAQLAVLMWDYVAWRPNYPQLIPNTSYYSSESSPECLCVCVFCCCTALTSLTENPHGHSCKCSGETPGGHFPSRLKNHLSYFQAGPCLLSFHDYDDWLGWNSSFLWRLPGWCFLLTHTHKTERETEENIKYVSAQNARHICL